MTSLNLVGIIAGDDVIVNYGAANFDIPDVGNGKTVKVSGITGFGTGAGNYAFNPITVTQAYITGATPARF